MTEDLRTWKALVEPARDPFFFRGGWYWTMWDALGGYSLGDLEVLVHFMTRVAEFLRREGKYPNFHHSQDRAEWGHFFNLSVAPDGVNLGNKVYGYKISSEVIPHPDAPMRIRDIVDEILRVHEHRVHQEWWKWNGKDWDFDQFLKWVYKNYFRLGDIEQNKKENFEVKVRFDPRAPEGKYVLEEDPITHSAWTTAISGYTEDEDLRYTGSGRWTLHISPAYSRQFYVEVHEKIMDKMAKGYFPWAIAETAIKVEL